MSDDDSIFWAIFTEYTLDWIPVHAVWWLTHSTCASSSARCKLYAFLGTVNESNGKQMCVCLLCCRWTRRRWRDWCCSIHTSCSVQWCRTVSERWNELIRWAGAPTHPRPPNTHTNMTPPQNHYHAVYSAFQHYAAETSILFDLSTNMFMHTWLWHAALHLFAFESH